MKIVSAYPAEIKESSGAFEATAVLYRQAVDYFIGIMLKHRDGSFSTITNSTFVVRAAEFSVGRRASGLSQSATSENRSTNFQATCLSPDKQRPKKRRLCTAADAAN